MPSFPIQFTNSIQMALVPQEGGNGIAEWTQKAQEVVELEHRNLPHLPSVVHQKACLHFSIVLSNLIQDITFLYKS